MSVCIVCCLYMMTFESVEQIRTRSQFVVVIVVIVVVNVETFNFIR